MCGFFFIKKKVKFEFNQKKLNSSADLISHRGPDGTKIYQDKDVFIKFFRLSIQDLSKNGMQPMISNSGSKLIVFNGEIYNFKSLRNILKKKDLKSKTDTEVILQLFEEIGLKIFQKMKGMYSLIIYDLKTKKILVARDQFGIKPLYFFENKKYLIFSSEIKPILEYNNGANINNNSLAEYFFLGKQDHYENTFFEEIKSIEPNHYYIFDRNKYKKTRYWSILSKKNNESDQYLTKQTLSKIDENLDKYLISDRKIGVFLSSGIDSTSLTAFTSKKLNRKIDTFTYDFKDNLLFGESFQASRNAKKLKVNNFLYTLTSKTVIQDFDKITRILESPFTSMRLFGVFGLYKLAKLKGYNVIIEGAGGDEILGGYNYNILPFILDQNKSKKKIIENLIKYSLRSPRKTELEILYRLSALKIQGASTTDCTPFVDINSFNRDYLDYTIDEKFFEIKKEKFKNFNKMNNLQKSQIQDLQEIKLPRNLKFTDRLSMINNIETRLPFLEQDFAKYCFNLKNSAKIKNGINRWIMKQALKKITRKLSFDKDKKSIVDPQTLWFKKNLRNYFIDNITSSNFKNMGIFDHKYILNKYNRFIKGEKLDSSFQFFQILSSFRFLEIFKK